MFDTNSVNKTSDSDTSGNNTSDNQAMAINLNKTYTDTFTELIYIASKAILDDIYSKVKPGYSPNKCVTVPQVANWIDKQASTKNITQKIGHFSWNQVENNLVKFARDYNGQDKIVKGFCDRFNRGEYWDQRCICS